MSVGYIYVRRHPSYDAFHACKLGKALNIPDRDSQYVTGEITRGRFTHVFQVSRSHMHLIEKWLHIEFSPWNIQFDAGTEFFHVDILPRIEPLFREHGIHYVSLSEDEIQALSRVARVQQLLRSIPRKSWVQAIKQSRLQLRQQSQHVDAIDLTDDDSLISDIMDSSSDDESDIGYESEKDDESKGYESEKEECDEYDEESSNWTHVVPAVVPAVVPSVVPSVVPLPRDYQSEIIQKTLMHFEHEDKGMLVLACGVGKTLISLWTAQALGAQTILIGVPSAPLADQWRDVVANLFPDRWCKVVDSKTSVDDLTRFILCAPRPFVIIALYASAKKVRNVAQHHCCTFDLTILDEAHHLTSATTLPDETDNRKAYNHVLQINSWKQLALTATLKTLECVHEDAVISNDDVEHFGACIDTRNLKWAIEQGILCDYVVQTMVLREDHLERSDLFLKVSSECDKRLFLCAYSVLKSIHDGHSHHVLVYANTMQNSCKIVYFIRQFLDNGYFDKLKGALAHGYYDSDMKRRDRENALANFKQAKLGILTCVYCLGEGWDLPLLDAVAFAENMVSSIRIVQCALRACRKNPLEPNKVAKIILPVFQSDNWGEDPKTDGLKKVRRVIQELGQQDDTIEHKFKVSLLPFQKQTGARASTQREATTADIDEEEDMDELAQQVKHFMIRSLNRSAFGFMPFDKARKLVANHNVKTLDQYYALCDKTPSLPKEPNVAYKGQFVNWVDFFGLDRGDFYDLETCKDAARKYCLLNPAIKRNHRVQMSSVCASLCALDPRFPPDGLWASYYGVSDATILGFMMSTGARKTAGVS